MSNLTEMVTDAMTMSMALMLASAILPEFGALLGAVLMLAGVIVLIRGLQRSHGIGVFDGIVTFLFGLATELASLEGLINLLIAAILVDVVLIPVKAILVRASD